MARATLAITVIPSHSGRRHHSVFRVRALASVAGAHGWSGAERRMCLFRRLGPEDMVAVLAGDATADVFRPHPEIVPLTIWALDLDIVWHREPSSVAIASEGVRETRATRRPLLGKEQHSESRPGPPERPHAATSRARLSDSKIAAGISAIPARKKRGSCSLRTTSASMARLKKASVKGRVRNAAVIVPGV